MTVTQQNRRHKASLFSIALLAVLALGVVGAGSAQAADWHWGQGERGTTFTLSGTSSETIAGTGSLSVSGSFGGTSLAVACNASSSGSITAGGTGSESIGLSGCAVSKPKTCEMQPATLSGSIQLNQAGGEVSESLVQKAGQPFVEMDFRGGSCPLSGLLVPINGSIIGAPPQGNLQEARSLAISSGSDVWLGNNPAKKAVVGGKLEEHLTGSSSRGAWGSAWEGTHGAWLIQPLVTPLLSSPEVVSVTGSSFGMKTTVSGVRAEFGCTGVKANVDTLVPGGTENAKLVLSGCVASQPPRCSVPATLELSLTGVLQSIAGQTYEKFSSAEGRPFFELQFSGPECGLGGILFPVTGTFAGLGPTWPAPLVSQGLEITPASNKAACAELRVGGKPGEFTGTFSRAFAGVRAGTPWAAY